MKTCIDKCGIWEKMKPCNIGLLLAAQPQFADKFDFARFNGDCWARILRKALYKKEG